MDRTGITNGSDRCVRRGSLRGSGTEKATLTEQARLKEQAARELDSKAKSIKDKSITDEPKK